MRDLFPRGLPWEKKKEKERREKVSNFIFTVMAFEVVDKNLSNFFSLLNKGQL